MGTKIQSIDPNLPPDIQLQMHSLNAEVIKTVASERTKAVALFGLAVIGIIVAAGSIYLASLKLDTPQFLAPVFATLIAAVALPLAYHMGQASEKKAAGTGNE